jgi:tape measure domain-containing protein
MEFDNRRFEENVATSLSTLDKLKKSLNMDGAAKGFDNINKAASNVNMSGLGIAVEEVGLKFRAMYTIADQALRNITTRVMNTAERMVKALTIDPIKTGLDEYEIKMNAIQTIQANTRGKNTMEDITAALEDLNTYADKTIYNFAQMTNNVGKFTAQGYDVKAAADAVKGLANLAAASGASAEDMARATYQMSQALGGTIRLMDWNSLRNANMATTELKNTLTALAKIKGIDVDSMIAEHGTFEQTLSEGWLSGEMFTEAMNIYSGLYSEAELKAKGFTDEQVKNFIDLAKMAESAATEVKTFTQLWDVLKETAQSGWTQTWEILIGDFETAKKMFTGLQVHFSDIINGWSNARNELLKGWVEAGGRQDLVDSFVNLYDAVVSVITPIKEAFREFFPPLTVEQLVKFTSSIKEFTVNLKESVKIGTTFSDRIKRIARGVFAVVDIVAEFGKALWNFFCDMLGIVTPVGDGVLGFAANLGDALVQLRDWIKSSDIFGKAFSGIASVLKVVGGGIKAVVSFLKGGFEALTGTEASVAAFTDRIKVRFQQLTKIGEVFKKAFMAVGGVVKGIWSVISPILSVLKDGIVTLTSGIANAFKNLFAEADFSTFLDLTNAGLFGGILFGIKKFIDMFHSTINDGGGIISGVKKFFGDIKESLTGTLGSVKDSLVSWQNSLKAQTLMTIAQAIAILAAALFVLSLLDSDKLGVALAAVTGLFIDLFGAMAIFQKVIGPKGVMEFGKLSTVMVGVSVAVLILSFAMAKLAQLDWNGLAKGLVGITAAIGILIGGMALLSLVVSKLSLDKWQTKKMSTMIFQMIGLAVAVRILASACEVFSGISWEGLAKGLIGMTGALAGLALALKLIPKSSALSAVGLVVASVALLILAGAMKAIGLLKWEEIGKGLVVIASALTLLALGLYAMSGTGFGAASLIVAATALVILAGALALISLLKWGDIAKGMVAIGGCLLVLAIGLTAMVASLPGAAALLVASASLAIIAPVLKLLGSMSWGAIFKGLIAMAAAFTILGVAGYVLKPVVGVIVALAGAFALIGVGMFAMGAGLVLVAAGIAAIATALSAGASAIAAGITIVLTSLIQLIPRVATALALGIIEFLKVLNEGASVIYDTIRTIVGGMVDVLVELVPKIADGAMKLIIYVLKLLAENTPQIVDYICEFLIGLLEGLAEHMPDLIQAAVDLFMAFFTGIVDALKSIDTGILIKGIAGIGLISMMLLALTALGALVPGAMVSILALGVLIGELSLVLAAIGAFAQIPGLKWLIESGGDFLMTVGNAIGKFVGGIVGGVAEGITSSLPKMATHLSEFMTNLTPFIEGAKHIDAGMMEGVKAIAETILLLTGANILEGLTSWLTGGSSLSEFGDQLADLGTDLNTFANNLGSFDESKAKVVTCAANAIKAMAEAAAAIPNEGGWAAKIFGENSLATFGSKLPELGTQLGAFANNLGTFDDTKVTTVTCAANAIKAMAEAAEAIPNEGGWAAKIAGDNSIADFGAKLPALGTNLASFVSNLGTFSDDKVQTVQAAVKAMGALAELADSDLKGAKKNIEGVGDKLGNFAKSIATFCKNLPESSKVTSATKSLKNVAAAIKDIASSDASVLKNISKALADLGEKGIKSFVDKFKSSGTTTDVTNAAKGIVDTAISGVESKENAFKKVFTDIASAIATGLKASYQSFYDAGSYLVIGFATGISENTFKAAAQATAMAKAAARAAEEALDINSPSKVFRAIGYAIPEGFAQGIEKLGGLVTSAAVSMTDGAQNGVTKSVSNIVDTISNDLNAQPTIRPVIDLTDVRNGAKAISGMFGGASVGLMSNVGAISSSMNGRSQNGVNDDVVSAIKDLRKDFEKFKGDTYNFGNIAYGDDTEVQNAVQTLVRAVKIGKRV